MKEIIREKPALLSPSFHSQVSSSIGANPLLPLMDLDKHTKTFA